MECDDRSLATWSPDFLYAISAGPGEAASRLESITAGAETALDRVVHPQWDPTLRTY